MATITPGTGATLTSTTAEGQLFSAIMFAEQQENDITRNPTGLNYVTPSLDYDSSNLTVTISSLPIDWDPSGNTLKLVVPDYLTGVTFTPGTGGTLQSATFAQYMVEALIYMANYESDASKLIAGQSAKLASSMTLGMSTLSATFTIPVTVSFSGGSSSIIATPWTV
jgi:hypothetical protein